MQLHHSATVSASAAVAMSILIALLLSAVDAHNITLMLAKLPEFSSFNHFLTLTKLTPAINQNQSLTACAVDNDAMAALLSKSPAIGSIKDVLALHVLTDYFDEKTLRKLPRGGSTTIATMYGGADVSITDSMGGKIVTFSVKQNTKVSATLVKSVQEIPSNISVIQISNLLSPPSMATASPSQNITDLLSNHGCKLFAEALAADPAGKTFESVVDAGLTVFCPGDDAMNGILPKLKNMTAAGKESLLEYHGVPAYLPLVVLQNNTEATNTLATNGDDKYDFVEKNDGIDLTIDTGIVTARILNTSFDKSPLIIYAIDSVLLPEELFDAPLAPPPGSDSPTQPGDDSQPVPSDQADTPSEDDVKKDNGAVKFNGTKLGAVIFGVWFIIMHL